MTSKKFSAFLCVAAILVGVLFTGCDKPESAPAAKPPAAKAPEILAKPLVQTAAAMDWCKEHAMPESICVQCHPELADGFKKKGDWCKEHEVPESQCFKCHPELQEKFAADFKAKYGKDVPATETQPH